MAEKLNEKKRKAETDLQTSLVTSQMLKIYYERHFPVEHLYKWLNSGSAREFGMVTHGDIFNRHLSFESPDALRRALYLRVPNKLEIGAISNLPANQHQLETFRIEGKELVFDIDINDYDRVCGCDKKTTICPNCWPLLTVAIQIIHSVLLEDFGFEHIRWIYSGRRGIHCWVSDEKVKKLSAEARAAIVNYISLDKKLYLPNPLPFCLLRASKLIKPLFERTFILNLNFLGTDNGLKNALKFFAIERRDQFEKHLKTETNGLTRWMELVKSCTTPLDQICLTKLMFHYMYPRLDRSVSLQLNHLLKSPFCIHPETGSLCVPIDPLRCDEFEPWDTECVPTLEHILANPSVMDVHIQKFISMCT